ncbi:MAG: DUF427 domain-containing protein [Candidatus Andersenbacteria bacterium]
MKATWNNKVIADSDNTEVVEGNHYFPPDSVKPELLQPSDTPYTCPWKGECQYYDLVDGDTRGKDLAWSYPDPKPAAENIRGYVAFDPRVEIV